MAGFAELGLSKETLDALGRIGYDTPTPIQEEAIPVLLAGRDMIGQAQTGTGKTAAFGLPMIEAVDPGDPEVQALVLTPTRELCIQVAQSLRAYGAVRGVDVLATFGGAPIRSQMDRLKSGPQVIVGTVGRVLDLMSRHALVLHSARYVVLDEADEMLDLGFLEDVEKILSKCPNGRQTGLFSATMPPPIARLAEKHLYDPETIKVKAPTLTIDTVEHFRLEVPQRDKPEALVKLLQAEKPRQAIVFVRTKIGADRLVREIERIDRGLRVRALHGDMSQGSRDGVMISFKDGRIPILVATDIAARGLDVERVTHVINYDLPNSAELYTHRIGRTGRIGRSGRALTLVDPRDKSDLAQFEKQIGIELKPWTAELARTAATDRAAGRDAADGPRTRRTGDDQVPSVGEGTEVVADAEAPTDADSESPTAASDDAPRDDAAEAVEAEPPMPERRSRRPRHVKPSQDNTQDDYSLVLVNVGAGNGLEPADVIELVTKHAQITGEQIRRVRVLEHFSLAHVPREHGERSAKALTGAFASGKKLVAEAVAISPGDGQAAELAGERSD